MKNIKLLWIFSGWALMSCMSACSTPLPADSLSEHDREIASEDAPQLGHSTYATELRFAAHSTRLDDTSKNKLSNLFDQAKESGRIDEVKVISWSDRVPINFASKALPKDQQMLADERARAASDFLRSLDPTLDVQQLNLAKNPNAIRELSNSDSKVQKSLNTGPDILHPEPGKTIILVLMRDRL